MNSIIQWFLLVILSTYLSTSGAQRLNFSVKRCNDPFEGTGYGPHDFRQYKRTDKQINIVERVHFKPVYRKKALYDIGDISIQMIGYNLDYTLRAIPNNPDALNAMSIFQARLLKKIPDYYNQPRKSMPADCYFRRAIAFVPNDVNVYNLYGMHFQRTGRLKMALEQFKRVVELQPDSANANNNLALIFYSLKMYKESAEAAKIAYAQGYKKPELKKRLKAKGYWK